METRFLVRNVEVDDELKDYMEKKLEKISKFFDRILSTQVSVNFKRGRSAVEITENVNGTIIRAEDSDTDIRRAFDRALKNIERQVKKHKETLNKKGRIKLQDIEFDLDSVILAEEPEGREIIRRKSFDAGTMTPDEATMQMDLLGHEFFIFKNSETGDINVVYKRKEGGYGLLEPK